MDEIYFEGTNGELYTSDDIIKAAYIMNSFELKYYDSNSIRNFASECSGIKCEIKPDVELFVAKGYKVRAIRLYYNLHKKENPNLTLVEAKNAIEEMEIKLKENKN